jgi:hypothetical protein
MDAEFRGNEEEQFTAKGCTVQSFPFRVHPTRRSQAKLLRSRSTVRNIRAINGVHHKVKIVMIVD